MRKLGIIFFFILSFLFAPCGNLIADSTQNDLTALVTKMDSLLTKVNELTEKNDKLQKEVDALRQENKQLRTALVSVQQNSNQEENTGVKSDEKTKNYNSSSESSQNTFYKQQIQNASQASYWLNTSSNVRHNKTCKWFNKTKKGRFCTKDEGKACGICGG